MSEHTNTTKRRSAIQIMGSLIGLVKPLLHIMLAAIILGTLGYLCAIFLTSDRGSRNDRSGREDVVSIYPGKDDYHSHDRDRSSPGNPALCGTVL